MKDHLRLARSQNPMVEPSAFSLGWAWLCSPRFHLRRHRARPELAVDSLLSVDEQPAKGRKGLRQLPHEIVEPIVGVTPRTDRLTYAAGTADAVPEPPAFVAVEVPSLHSIDHPLALFGYGTRGAGFGTDIALLAEILKPKVHRLIGSQR